MAVYYVTPSGSDANDGLSEASAFASPGYACGVATLGDLIYIKAGTYTLTTVAQNVSGGPLLVGDDVHIEGYSVTPGDRAALPVIHSGAVSPAAIVEFASVGFNGPFNSARLIEVDGNSLATSGFNSSQNYTSTMFDCVARNCGNGFYSGSNNGFMVGCEAWDCSIRGFANGAQAYCRADGCSEGFASNKSPMRCIASNNTNSGFNFSSGFITTPCHCVAYGNGGNGFLGSYDINQFLGCIAVNNGSYGYNVGATTGNPMLIDCADFGNTSGRTRSGNTGREVRPITLTGDPFVDAANGDFRLNDTPGAGAACRQIEISTLAGVQSVLDLGAIDAIVSGGGGGGTTKKIILIGEQ